MRHRGEVVGGRIGDHRSELVQEAQLAHPPWGAFRPNRDAGGDGDAIHSRKHKAITMEAREEGI